jgi:lysozyme
MHVTLVAVCPESGNGGLIASAQSAQSRLRASFRRYGFEKDVVVLDVMDPRFLDQIKKFEGFTREAKWDYAQYSNGYGTRAAFKGEVIDEAEADRRFREELKMAGELVDKFSPGLDSGSRAALVSLTFNAGTTWMRSGLGEAVRNGDLSDAKRIFLQYTKAGGVDLPGLQSRRSEEATWFQVESVQDIASNDTLAHARPGKSQSVAAETLMPRGSPSLRNVGSAKMADAANELFEQLKMDRVRLLVLSEKDERLRGEVDV